MSCCSFVGQKVRDGFTTIKNYRGVSVPISYDPTPTAADWDGMKNLMLVQVRGGKWVIIEVTGRPPFFGKGLSLIIEENVLSQRKECKYEIFSRF